MSARGFTVRIPWAGFKVGVSLDHLDDNFHGHSRDADGQFVSRTLRSTWLWVALGKDVWMRYEGRKLVGRRLWRYDRHGAAWSVDAFLVFDRSPYRPPSKYAPEPQP